MIKEIVKGIMTKPDGRVNVCTVVKQVAPSVYSVTDEVGRTFNAESVLSWPLGSEVLVRGGQILGKSAQQTEIKIINV